MRRLAALLVAFISLPALAQFSEQVTVARILLDVRVTDFTGDAIVGLEADDFEVTVGGRKADVLSVTWVTEGTARQLEAFEAEQDGQPAPPSSNRPEGRLFVYFIQTDFGRASTRTRGQMHFFHYVDEMLKMLAPEDRVAVFSFDSHLKFRLDFTSDKEKILAAVKESMLINHPEPPPIVPNPSLSSRLNREEMKKAVDSEAALIIVGNALRHIPGPKSLMLMGWGLGELVMGGGVRMKPRWRIARNALEASRVTIFSLDTTDAASHSLEVGLGKAASDTGGFYAKTHIFPMQAVERLRRTLEGHYELELRRPDGLKSGTHEVSVNVKRRGVYVLAPSSWMDR